MENKERKVDVKLNYDQLIATMELISKGEENGDNVDILWQKIQPVLRVNLDDVQRKENNNN